MRTGMQPSSWPRPSDQGLGQLVWQVLASWQVWYTAGHSSGAFLVLYCMVDLYSAIMVLGENTHHKRLTHDKRQPLQLPVSHARASDIEMAQLYPHNKVDAPSSCRTAQNMSDTAL